MHLWGTGTSCWLIMPAEVAALAFSNQDCIVARDFFFYFVSGRRTFIFVQSEESALRIIIASH